ncbi:SLC13 family permease [Macrococcus animalis]|uniref:SLC13 family permease n=1 Tax=Macrococcus animalis TaxID=3395467 RepID=UPI0039BDA9E2
MKFPIQKKDYLTHFSEPELDIHHAVGYNKVQLIGLILGPLFFILFQFFIQPPGLVGPARFVLAATLWIATWWITEPIPIAVTSLLPLVLFPMGQIMDAGKVAANYGNDIIFLFMGGFILAIAMEQWNLHTRIALNIIQKVGTTTSKIILGFMMATGVMSMFVSNTAAVMIMIPIGLALIAEAEVLSSNQVTENLRKFEKTLVLAIGYAGTIGGMGTLIGTPPLILLAGQMKEIFGFEIGFGQWMVVGVPSVIILLLITWLYLHHFAFKSDMTELPGGKEVIDRELQKLGKTTREEKIILAIFLLAATLWIVRGFFFANIPALKLIQDGTIAMFISILLFMIPTKRKSGRLLDWSVAKEIPWGVLLLFGGGLALANAITTSKLDAWLSDQLILLKGMPIILIITVTALFVLFLTEITSNTATATMILPILAALALAINVHPLALMIPAAMGANCAFMLPVGTPPNAIVFGTGKVSIREMASTGFWLNLIACVIIVIAVYLIVPFVFGIDISPFPEGLKK